MKTKFKIGNEIFLVGTLTECINFMKNIIKTKDGKLTKKMKKCL